MFFYLINFVIYLLLWFIFYKHFKRFNLFMVAWSGYTLSALMSFFLFDLGLYYYSLDFANKNNVIGPLLCVLATNLIIILPFRKVDEKKINFSEFNTEIPFYKMFIKVNLVFFFIVSIMKIYEASYAGIFISYADIYDMIHDDDESTQLRFLLYSSPILITLSGVGGNYCPTMSPLLMIYFINKIVKQNKLSVVNLLCIIVTLTPVVLQGVINASRGNLFFAVFQLLFYYIIVHHYLSKKIRRSIFVGSLLVLFVLFGVSYNITESRVDNRRSTYTAYEDILVYFGQPMLNVCYFNDKIKKHPNGSRILDIRNDGGDKLTFKDYWNCKTGSEIQLFKTLYGDLFLEFGFLGAFIFVLFFSILWDRLVIRNYYKPIYIPFLWMYFNILIYGIFNFNYRILLNSFGTWSCLLIVMCVYINNNSKRKKGKNLVCTSNRIVWKKTNWLRLQYLLTKMHS